VRPQAGTQEPEAESSRRLRAVRTPDSGVVAEIDSLSPEQKEALAQRLAAWLLSTVDQVGSAVGHKEVGSRGCRRRAR
jgi:hypothetical protein